MCIFKVKYIGAVSHFLFQVLPENFCVTLETPPSSLAGLDHIWTACLLYSTLPTSSATWHLSFDYTLVSHPIHFGSPTLEPYISNIFLQCFFCVVFSWGGRGG